MAEVADAAAPEARGDASEDRDGAAVDDRRVYWSEHARATAGAITMLVMLVMLVK